MSTRLVLSLEISDWDLEVTRVLGQETRKCSVASDSRREDTERSTGLGAVNRAGELAGG
jgi:hypothetical protein